MDLLHWSLFSCTDVAFTSVFRKKTLPPWFPLCFFLSGIVIIPRSQSKKRVRFERETKRKHQCERDRLRPDSSESVNNMPNIWCVPAQPDQLIAIPVAWWPAGHWVLSLLHWNRAHLSLRLSSTLEQLLALKTGWPSLLQQTERWKRGQPVHVNIALHQHLW